MSDCCFQLKGSVLTAVVLELHRYSETDFALELQQKIDQAPRLLDQSPVVFNLDKYAGETLDIDLGAVVSQCQKAGLQPIGVRSNARFNALIQQLGLPVLSSSNARADREMVARPTATKTAAPKVELAEQAPISEPAVPVASKLVTQPVRSGQQIYARGGDLIVMSQVSEGAEVLADGNVHIYGSLRGRALAGVTGNTEARIFCHRMEAELLSVAGNFMLSDDMDEQFRKQPVQAYLEGERLMMVSLQSGKQR